MEIRRATKRDILFVAANLRESDRREIWASHRSNPEDIPGLCKEVETWAAIAENPLCIFGCASNGNSGVPWLLATDDVLNHKVEFLRKSRDICREWLKQFKLLTNIVHAENDICILWLKWLGFSFPAVVMINGEKFMRFEKRWQDVPSGRTWRNS